MIDTFMVNWSGQAIPSNELGVLRRVAVEMRTIHGVDEVSFKHEICEGIVRYEKTDMYGNTPGLFFFGDLDSKNNEPNTVNFFIPRRVLMSRVKPDMVVCNTVVYRDGKQISAEYPEDIDPELALGTGDLVLTIRTEN